MRGKHQGPAGAGQTAKTEAGVIWKRLQITAAGASLLCALPALAGMGIGQIIRANMDPITFRRLFMIELLLFGGHLMVRSIL